MAQFGVSPVAMYAAVEETRNIGNRLQSALTEMHADVLARMGENWTGEAREAYDIAYAKCKGAADLMPHMVNDASSTVHQLTGNYDEAEAKIRGYFGD